MRSGLFRSAIAAIFGFAILVGAAASQGFAAPVSAAVDSQIAVSTARGEWLTWGGDSGFQRYSPLDQINAGNVGTLEMAWRRPLLPLGAGRPDRNSESTPLMVGGVMYLSNGATQVSAINPGTGETIWTSTPPPYQGGRGGGGRTRGLAYWTDGKVARLFNNTGDGRLLSIDAATGAADLAFGKDGQIFLKEGLMREVPGVGSSSPPTVVGDVVVAQFIRTVTEPQKEAAPGWVRGFDVRTGKLLWTFHTVPLAGEFGNETWGDNSWSYTGNTDIWTMMSADQDLGYIYLPIGAATQDFYGGHRPGANLFSESLVALDAKTGKRVWHFQLTHHGLWDYDPPAAPILHDVVINGKRIKAVTQLTKQGFAYVFDRTTGKPIWPIPERPAPSLPIPGDKQWPTQPVPTKPPPFAKQGYKDDYLIDFTPELKKEALAIAQKYERGPLFTPVIPARDGKLGTWVLPSMQGGANWPGGAFDPNTGLLFVPSRDVPFAASLVPGDPAVTTLRFTRPGSVVIEGPQGLPINKPPWTTVTALNMNRGTLIWQKAIGGAPDSVRNNPALKGLKLDFDSMGKWNINPGAVVTKTLMFMGEGGGLVDGGGPMFRAYDKTTGKVVAEFQLPAPATAAPMTYLYNGRQYIAVVVSSGDHPAELVSLALPDGNKPRAAATTATPTSTPSVATPSLSRSEATTARQLFAQNCTSCHGNRGEGRPGLAPSLSNAKDANTVLAMVRDGGVQMPSFGSKLSAEQIGMIARFVASGGPLSAP